MSKLFYALAMLASNIVAEADVLSTDSSKSDIKYQPARVVYDLTSGDLNIVTNILNRVAILQDLYGAGSSDGSIIILLHGSSVPLFIRDNQGQNAEAMRYARDLADAGVIRFAMCKMSANFQGFEDKQVQEFVTLVPMGDAELIRLQNMGYAYLR